MSAEGAPSCRRSRIDPGRQCATGSQPPPLPEVSESCIQLGPVPMRSLLLMQPASLAHLLCFRVITRLRAPAARAGVRGLISSHCAGRQRLNQFLLLSRRRKRRLRLHVVVQRSVRPSVHRCVCVVCMCMLSAQ